MFIKETEKKQKEIERIGRKRDTRERHRALKVRVRGLYLGSRMISRGLYVYLSKNHAPAIRQN
jgi:hypothetical protein